MPTVAENNNQNNTQGETTLTPEQQADLAIERENERIKAAQELRSKGDTPFTAYRFLIYFDGVSDVDRLQAAFTGFSGIRMSNQVAQFRSGDDIRGVKDNYPALTEYEHVKLTKGVIGKSDFIDWLFNSTFPGTETAPKGKGPKCSIIVKSKEPKGEDQSKIDESKVGSMYQNVRVVSLMEPSNEPGMEWILINAIPVGYELHPMDASQSSYLSEEIELAFTGVKRNSLWQGEKGLLENELLENGFLEKLL